MANRMLNLGKTHFKFYEQIRWTITHCSGLGHELMVSAVCLSIFLWNWFYQWCFMWDMYIGTVCNMCPVFCQKWQNKNVQSYVNCTLTSEVTPVTIQYIQPPHNGNTKSKSWLWMDDSHLFHSMSIGCPNPEMRLIQTQPLKLQGQGHGCCQKARSYNETSILFIHFLFISHQLDQPFLRYSCFEILLWKIQAQGHEWGQRSSKHGIPSIQLMHFLSVSHQSDQPWDMAKKSFQQNL